MVDGTPKPSEDSMLITMMWPWEVSKVDPTKIILRTPQSSSSSSHLALKQNLKLCFSK